MERFTVVRVNGSSEWDHYLYMGDTESGHPILQSRSGYQHIHTDDRELIDVEKLYES